MEITDVFTPRSSTVNEEMYVSRPNLEKALEKGLKRNIHNLLTGESGNGKSWLYKKVLHYLDMPFKTVNLSLAARHGNIVQEILKEIETDTIISKTAYSETIAAGVNVAVARGTINHTNNYSIIQSDLLLQAFEKFDSQHPNKRKIIVLDNLESIFNNSELMSELANILLLLDDNNYAKYKVYFLIVGTPNGVLEYFRRTENSSSVANRIKEIDEVKSLNYEQVKSIIENGLRLLSFQINDSELEALIYHIYNVTLGVAQRVQEYGELLSYEIQDNNNIYEDKLLKKTDFAWLNEGLKECYQKIEMNLNSRRTEVQRKNQVIYCIGKIDNHQFDSNIIEQLIKEEFPETLPETNMGLNNILSALAEGGSAILNRNATNNISYSIKDPRYLMCIRVMLRKTGNRVEKNNFTSQQGLIEFE